MACQAASEKMPEAAKTGETHNRLCTMHKRFFLRFVHNARRRMSVKCDRMLSSLYRTGDDKMGSKETSYRYEEVSVFRLNELVKEGVRHEIVHWFNDEVDTTWCVVKVFEQAKDEKVSQGDCNDWEDAELIVFDNSDNEGTIPICHALLKKVSSGETIKSTGYIYSEQLAGYVQDMCSWARDHKYRITHRNGKRLDFYKPTHPPGGLMLVVVDMSEREDTIPQSYAFLLNDWGLIEKGTGYVFGKSLPYHEQNLRDWARANDYPVDGRYELGV
jgi:hypothetical protein